jgi:hypothetical protein
LLDESSDTTNGKTVEGRLLDDDLVKGIQDCRHKALNGGQDRVSVSLRERRRHDVLKELLSEIYSEI